jgi:4,5-DOPA dioxygenase extradiol
MGSGNIVHNLMALDPDAEPYSWALEFDDIVKNNLVQHDIDSLVNYSKYHISALAHPTSEHYLPLLCVVGAAGNDRPEFFNESIFGGSVSMRSVVYGVENLNL